VGLLLLLDLRLVLAPVLVSPLGTLLRHVHTLVQGLQAVAEQPLSVWLAPQLHAPLLPQPLAMVLQLSVLPVCLTHQCPLPQLHASLLPQPLAMVPQLPVLPVQLTPPRLLPLPWLGCPLLLLSLL